MEKKYDENGTRLTCTDAIPNDPDLTQVDPAIMDDYIKVDFLGMPVEFTDPDGITWVGNKKEGSGDYEYYPNDEFKALNPINPSTFIPVGVEQVEFTYCDDALDTTFQLMVSIKI